jgi:hypothetical protein
MGPVAEAGWRSRRRVAAIQPARAATPPTTPPTRPSSRLATTPTPRRGTTGARTGAGLAWGGATMSLMMSRSGTKLRSPDRNSSTASRLRQASWTNGFSVRRSFWSLMVGGVGCAAAAMAVALASAAPSASTASSRSGRPMMSPQCGGGRWVRRATHDKNDPAPSRVYRQSRRRPGVLQRSGLAPDGPERPGSAGAHRRSGPSNPQLRSALGRDATCPAWLTATGVGCLPRPGQPAARPGRPRSSGALRIKGGAAGAKREPLRHLPHSLSPSGSP